MENPFNCNFGEENKEVSLKMTEKKTRLLCEDDVIKAVDKHTNDDGSLDDDISCILEEVKDVIIAGSKKAMKELNKPITGIMPESKLSLTCPRVFMFKTDLPIENVIQVQKILKDQIEEGCLVIPDCVEFIGIEDPIVVLP